MTEIREKNHAYWGWRAEGYSSYNQQELEDERKQSWKSELEAVIRQQKPEMELKDIKILDIGTGPGFFAILASELGMQVTAMDFTQEMLDQAQKNAGEYAKSIQWVRADAQNLPFDEESFDVLITRNVTWNLPNPKKAYEEWLRVLNWNGVLVNYDANWYQYLFSDKKKEEYEADRDNARMRKAEDCNVGDGFDVMEEIAREIPMGRENRPYWDLEVMEKLGYCDIQIDMQVYERVWSEDEKISCASTPMFRIVGCKKKCEERIVRYWSERSSSFLDQRRAELHDEINQRWIREIEEICPKGKKLRILDVGCGTGFFTILLTKLGHEVIGIDLTPAMIDGARMLAVEEGVSCQFQIMDAEHPEFPDESFDMVISRNLTWTLPHPDEAYREWLRVLKQDGILLNFDADYGLEDSSDVSKLPEIHAHHMIGERMRRENDAIKSQLPITFHRRPMWDIGLLSELGAEKFHIDMGVSKRIYIKVDEFLNPTPLFKLWIIK